MKKLLTILMLLFACEANAAPMNIYFWMSSYYDVTGYGVFLPISGHFPISTIAVGSDNAPQLVPEGTFTKLTCVTNVPTVGNSAIVKLYVTRVATTAVCTVADLATTCTWQGAIPVKDTDYVNLNFTFEGVGGGADDPLNCILIEQVNNPKKDWPFTS